MDRNDQLLQASERALSLWVQANHSDPGADLRPSEGFLLSNPLLRNRLSQTIKHHLSQHTKMETDNLQSGSRSLAIAPLVTSWESRLMLPWEQSTFLAPPPQGRCGAWPQGGRRTKISHGSSARPVSIARERRKDAHWLNFSKQNILWI